MALTNPGLSPEHLFFHALEHCTTHAEFFSLISYQDKCTLVALHNMAAASPSLPSDRTNATLLFDVKKEDWLREWDKLRDITLSEVFRSFANIINSNSVKFGQWMDEAVSEHQQHQQQQQQQQQQQHPCQPGSKPDGSDSTYVKRPSHIQILEPTSNSLSPISLSIEDVTKLTGSAGRSELPDKPTVSDLDSELCMSPVTAGYLWCKRSQAVEFINSVKDDPDARVLIAPGESITVKVPVHPTLSTLFWEYATERHDVGFGVELEVIADDASTPLNSPSELTQIIRMERRHSCEDVIVGCHRAASLAELHSHRTYYLRFDNKYSLFTRKVFYYRVYSRTPTPLQ